MPEIILHYPTDRYIGWYVAMWNRGDAYRAFHSRKHISQVYAALHELLTNHATVSRDLSEYIIL